MSREDEQGQPEVSVSTPADVSSVANRTNNSRRVSSDKNIRGNVLGNYRTRRDDRVLAYSYATDDRRAGCDPDVSFNHDGLCDY